MIKNPNFLKDLDTNRPAIKSKEYIEVDQFKIKKKQESHKEDKKTSFKLEAKKPDSSFEDFTFGINKEEEKEKKENLEQFNTMEFTHQHLNKDFMTMS